MTAIPASSYDDSFKPERTPVCPEIRGRELMKMSQEGKGRILVTGCSGQIGTELLRLLAERYGQDRILGTDIKEPSADGRGLAFRTLDVTRGEDVDRLVREEKVDTIYHLAAILSAVGERRPELAWQVNMQGLYHVLESARVHGCRVFTPSSIAAFGPGTPPDRTPQDTLQRPTSMYGVTKVAGELLCDYYALRYGVDCRGVRYPGIISHETLPGGGTTDYAVDIFYKAVQEGRYTCFLSEHTQLDMMYMPDALKAAVDLMEADVSRLRHRNAFNVTAFSVTPALLAEAIRGEMPGFASDYEVDPVRQGIADSWPNSLDDTAAREEWGWSPDFSLEAMVSDMLAKLSAKLK